MNLNQENQPVECFFSDIRNDIKIYTNVSSILEKSERDGYLDMIRDTIDEVLKKEISFAVQGELNSFKENEREETGYECAKSLNDKYLCF